MKNQENATTTKGKNHRLEANIKMTPMLEI